jgi:hypothetical protein
MILDPGGGGVEKDRIPDPEPQRWLLYWKLVSKILCKASFRSLTRAEFNFKVMRQYLEILSCKL